MGAPMGDPKTIYSARQQAEWFQRMMADPGYRRYTDAMRATRPRDIYIAGQVIDGVTGEIKKT